MEPVFRTRPRILLALLAAVLLLSTVTYYWHQVGYDKNKAPISVNELDSQMMETGRDEVVQQILTPNQADDRLQQAKTALTENRPDVALKLVDEILKTNANNADAYIVRGQAFRRKGEPVRAAEAFSRVIALQPELAEPYLYRGHVYKASKQYEQAMKDYDLALKKNPKLSAAYYHRGDILLRLEQYELAKVEFSAAIEIQSATNRFTPTPFFKRGYLSYIKMEYKAAIRDISRAIELAPRLYEGYLYRANALVAIARYDLAINDYNELIRLKPDFPLGYYGRALAWREKGETAKAESDFRKAEQLGIKRMSK